MVSLQNILFLDIETVSQYPDYERLPDSWKDLWSKKAEILLRNREDQTAESIYERSSIYAEFGKIICISCGILTGSGSNKRLLVKSFSGMMNAYCWLHSAICLPGGRPISKNICAHITARSLIFPICAGVW